MQPAVRMGPGNRLRRTRTDADRIEQITWVEVNRGGMHVVDLDLDVRPWLAGTVVSAVQVQVRGEPPVRDGPRLQGDRRRLSR